MLIVPLAADPVADHDRTLYWLGTGLLLVGALLVGALLLAWARRWHQGMSDADQPANMLSAFRSSYERGELSEDEYRRIRARLGGANAKISARPEPQPASPDRPPTEGRTPETPNAE